MSDFGILRNSPEQRQDQAVTAEILAEYVAEVRENLSLLRSLGQLSHPSAARMAMGISMQPAPEQPAEAVVAPPVSASEEDRLTQLRREIARMPQERVQVEGYDNEIAT